MGRCSWKPLAQSSSIAESGALMCPPSMESSQKTAPGFLLQSPQGHGTPVPGSASHSQSQPSCGGLGLPVQFTGGCQCRYVLGHSNPLPHSSSDLPRPDQPVVLGPTTCCRQTSWAQLPGVHLALTRRLHALLAEDGGSATFHSSFAGHHWPGLPCPTFLPEQGIRLDCRDQTAPELWQP